MCSATLSSRLSGWEPQNQMLKLMEPKGLGVVVGKNGVGGREGRCSEIDRYKLLE